MYQAHHVKNKYICSYPSGHITHHANKYKKQSPCAGQQHSSIEQCGGEGVGEGEVSPWASGKFTNEIS